MEEYTKEVLEIIYDKLINEKDGSQLREIGSNSDVMANYNDISEKYLLAAIKLGVNEAYTDLGVLYIHHFKNPNYEKGFTNYLKSARLGDKRAIRLYLRDMAWFDYSENYDEVVDLSIKFKEPKGVIHYTYRLLYEGKIEEALNALSSIYEVDPNSAIEGTIIKLQNSYDETEIIKDLIDYATYWYSDLLLENAFGGLGDDGWFIYTNITEDYEDYIYLDILSVLLKRAADNGNPKACFAYGLFETIGICLSEANEEEGRAYLEKALEQGLENGDYILKKFEDPFYDTDTLLTHAPTINTDNSDLIKETIQLLASSTNKIIPLNTIDITFVPELYYMYEYDDINNLSLGYPLLEGVTDVILVFEDKENLNLSEVHRIVDETVSMYGPKTNIIYTYHNEIYDFNKVHMFFL